MKSGCVCKGDVVGLKNGKTVELVGMIGKDWIGKEKNDQSHVFSSDKIRDEFWKNLSVPVNVHHLRFNETLTN